MRIRYIKGFSLLETLIALALSTIIITTVARTLPLIFSQNQQQLTRNQFQQELQHILMIIEKAVRRAGFCHGVCVGSPLIIEAEKNCLLVQWDDNANGRWDDDELFGWRLKQQNLETQRGQRDCTSQGWERITDPNWIKIKTFSLKRSAALTASPKNIITIESWVWGENL